MDPAPASRPREGASLFLLELAFLIVLPVLLPVLLLVRRGRLRGKGTGLLFFLWLPATAIWALVIAVATRHGLRGVGWLGVAAAALTLVALLWYALVVGLGVLVSRLVRTTRDDREP